MLISSPSYVVNTDMSIMPQRNVILIWTFNCGFFLINFYLWAYSPNETRTAQGATDRFEKLLESYVDEEELIARHSKSRRLSSQNDPGARLQDGEPLPPEFQLKYDPEKNNAIVERWKNETGHHFESLNASSTDMYLPYETRHVNSSQVHYRAGYQVPRIAYTRLVRCAALLAGDKAELDRAQAVMVKLPKEPIYEETYVKWTDNCPSFLQERGYVQMPLSQEEESFPLAFSIAMYTDIEQTERLLRAIYQPQNIYCIHIDTKSPLLLHRTVQALVRCFPNVFIASHLDKIKWGDVSVLLPALNCMRDLVRLHRGKWKYYINLTGQEMPLRTNWELVQIARIFNGSNDIGGSRTRLVIRAHSC